MKAQLAMYKSIRKPKAPRTRVIRPLKGRGYMRPRNGKEFHGQD